MVRAAAALADGDSWSRRRRARSIPLRLSIAWSSVLQLEIINVACDVAVPQVSVLHRRAVNHRILIAQLDLLFNQTRLHIVTEKCFQIGVGHPERIAVPTHSVSAIACQLPVGLNLPGFGIEHKQPAGRESRDVEQPITVLDALPAKTTGSSGRFHRQLSGADHRPIAATLFSAFRSRTRKGRRLCHGSGRRITLHMEAAAGAGSPILCDSLAFAMVDAENHAV